MSAITFVFALVLVALCVAVALSLMFAVNSNSRSKALETTWAMSKPAKLSQEVADLAGVLDAHKAATRSEFGKVWQKFAAPPPVAVPLAVDLGPDVGELDVCENWAEAQLHGPGSEAARCSCLYCMTQRNARAAEKSRILAERRKSKPVNGSE